jgi:hypothetical protein
MRDKRTEPHWPDDENWLEILTPALINDPERAEMVALIWRNLVDCLKDGKRGIERADAILNDALRMTYPFTASYQLAYRHWQLCLSSGAAPPSDEPQSLLSESIGRVNAAVAGAKRKQSVTGRRRKHSARSRRKQ